MRATGAREGGETNPVGPSYRPGAAPAVDYHGRLLERAPATVAADATGRLQYSHGNVDDHIATDHQVFYNLPVFTQNSRARAQSIAETLNRKRIRDRCLPASNVQHVGSLTYIFRRSPCYYSVTPKILHAYRFAEYSIRVVSLSENNDDHDDYDAALWCVPGRFDYRSEPWFGAAT